MHCDNCVAKVENALNKIGTVQSVKVTLQPPRVEITMFGNITLAQFNVFLALAGEYRLSEIHNDEPMQSSTLKKNKMNKIGNILLRMLKAIFIRKKSCCK